MKREDFPIPRNTFRDEVREKMQALPIQAHSFRIYLMEAEHINAIGNQLADLSTRVNELRGYL